LASLYHRLIDARFGTYRGLIRLALAHGEAAVGRLADFSDPDLARVDRLVFVCLGNVCRSPYGELMAREHGLPTASFGLSTTTGVTAYPDGVETARRRGRDLTGHVARNISDFEIRDGDLLLTMEVRHARRLDRHLQAIGSAAQIALLGSWASPGRPHIHDPMTLSADYFLTCYRVIESAVGNLALHYKQAKGGGSS